MRRRWVSIGIVLGVVASVLPTYASVASAREVARADTGIGSITWGPCTNATLVNFGAECGMLTVPLDYARLFRRDDPARSVEGPAHRA